MCSLSTSKLHQYFPELYITISHCHMLMFMLMFQLKFLIMLIEIFVWYAGALSYNNDGDLSVVTSITSNIPGGRLQVYLQKYNAWIPFCISSFDMNAATLACHQLGYLYVSRYGTVRDLG